MAAGQKAGQLTEGLCTDVLQVNMISQKRKQLRRERLYRTGLRGRMKSFSFMKFETSTQGILKITKVQAETGLETRERN